MIQRYRNEKWKEVLFDETISEKHKFKISNYGRILNCNGEKEVLVKGSLTNGYLTIPLKQKISGKSTARYVHKLLAEHFLERNEGMYVLHLDHDKINNRIENLKWATKREKGLHQKKNPAFINKPKRPYSKLTEVRVRLIKRKINDPNRRTRMKMIAKQFGISEMQLYRIKSGENWGDVTEY